MTPAQRAAASLVTLGWSRSWTARVLGVAAPHVTRWVSASRRQPGDKTTGREPAMGTVMALELLAWLRARHERVLKEWLGLGTKP